MKLVEEFMTLKSQLKDNSDPWASDGTRWPFVLELRKHGYVKVEDLKEDTAYVTNDNGSGIYANGTNVGYYTAPSVIVTGKFTEIEGRKVLEATIYGGTFHVTSNPGTANQSATWSITTASKSTGVIYINDPFCPPSVVELKTALSTLKEYLGKLVNAD